MGNEDEEVEGADDDDLQSLAAMSSACSRKRKLKSCQLCGAKETDCNPMLRGFLASKWGPDNFPWAYGSPGAATGNYCAVCANVFTAGGYSHQYAGSLKGYTKHIQKAPEDHAPFMRSRSAWIEHHNLPEADHKRISRESLKLAGETVQQGTTGPPPTRSLGRLLAYELESA